MSKFRLIPVILILLALFITSSTGQTPTISAQNGSLYTTYLPITTNSPQPPSQPGDWPMVAANPQRTSWSPAEVNGNLRLEWYLPVEGYIPQNSQIIAAHGLLYISTSAGLYALNADNGSLVWRFNTDMPLGNSPTVASGIVYVGGYDRKLHALDAMTGTHLWSFDGAQAGYDTNPLVVDGIVYAGNRDGRMYAIGAHGTPQQGQQIWSFATEGAIHLSPAYHNGTIYFASNDNHAYALNAATGSQIWRSGRLPGDGYHSYWPVIYDDLVIFSATFGYRNGDPGLSSIEDEQGEPYGKYHDIERDELFPNGQNGQYVGQFLGAQPWSNGKQVINGSRITEYYEGKPWRRTYIALRLDNGTEYTYDSDGDGRAEYIPAAFWGAQSGNRYPPIVGADNLLYFNNIYQYFYIPQGQVMSWNKGTPYLGIIGGQGAIDEPQAISAAGNTLYRNICCDRVGDWYSMSAPNRSAQLWNYSNPLTQQAPGYDAMWNITSGGDRLTGWYRGNTTSVNAAYHNHGDQNPIIPYNGRLYVHRSNAIIAYGPGGSATHLPLLTAQPAASSSTNLSTNTLRTLLEHEVDGIIAQSSLKPGYYNVAQFTYAGLTNYFENPGDTLYALSAAYPHLSAAKQTQVRTFLTAYYATHFANNTITRIGWNNGAQRDTIPYPPEVATHMSTIPASGGAGNGFLWSYPQINFYGMWQYAENVPGVNALTVYNLAKSKLIVPLPTPPVSDYWLQQPYELNAWIAGYIGFLELQELAGMSQTDAALRTQVTNQLNQLLNQRITNFTKDSHWYTQRFHKKHLDISRNFMFLVPELGDHLGTHLRSQVQQAVNEYDTIAPYWFVSRYESTIGEGVMSTLYNYHGMFLAKAYVLDAPREELVKYLDVPAFHTGDLFYMQNLIATLEAPTSTAVTNP
jgi:outer membrane protein assembly factor BamB